MPQRAGLQNCAAAVRGYHPQQSHSQEVYHAVLPGAAPYALPDGPMVEDYADGAQTAPAHWLNPGAEHHAALDDAPALHAVHEDCTLAG